MKYAKATSNILLSSILMFSFQIVFIENPVAAGGVDNFHELNYKEKALNRAIKSMKAAMLDASDRTIVISERDGFIVVSFLNAIPARREEPHLVYDPKLDKIVFIMGDSGS